MVVDNRDVWPSFCDERGVCLDKVSARLGNDEGKQALLGLEPSARFEVLNAAVLNVVYPEDGDQAVVGRLLDLEGFSDGFAHLDLRDARFALLHNAIQYGDVAVVGRLLDLEGFSAGFADVRYDERFALLRTAIQYGRVVVVGKLLELEGFSAGFADVHYDARFALLREAVRGCSAVVGRLWDLEGLFADVRYDARFALLYNAIQYGDVAVVGKLLDLEGFSAGFADVRYDERFALLRDAIQYGYVAVVGKLLAIEGFSNGFAHVDFYDRSDFLREAVRGRDEAVVGKLLELEGFSAEFENRAIISAVLGDYEEISTKGSDFVMRLCNEELISYDDVAYFCRVVLGGLEGQVVPGQLITLINRLANHIGSLRSSGQANAWICALRVNHADLISGLSQKMQGLAEVKPGERYYILLSAFEADNKQVFDALLATPGFVTNLFNDSRDSFYWAFSANTNLLSNLFSSKAFRYADLSLGDHEVIGWFQNNYKKSHKPRRVFLSILGVLGMLGMVALSGWNVFMPMANLTLYLFGAMTLVGLFLGEMTIRSNICSTRQSVLSMLAAPLIASLVFLEPVLASMGMDAELFLGAIMLIVLVEYLCFSTLSPKPIYPPLQQAAIKGQGGVGVGAIGYADEPSGLQSAAEFDLGHGM